MSIGITLLILICLLELPLQSKSTVTLLSKRPPSRAVTNDIFYDVLYWSMLYTAAYFTEFVIVFVFYMLSLYILKWST